MLDQRRVFGHPRALRTLTFVEAWERFSFYGLRSILVFYLYFPPARGGLGLSKQLAATEVSAYAALVYFSGLAGGWIGDRLLGARRAMVCGGLVITAGHVVLAIPSGEAGCYFGLLLIVLGTGLLKTNVSTLVGSLYRGARASRDAGFSLFYTGLSFGGFAGPLVAGWLQDNVNFHVAFAATAVGMLAGLAVYLRSAGDLASLDPSPPNPLTGEHRKTVLRRIAVGAAALLALFGALSLAGRLTMAVFVNVVTGASIAAPVGYWLAIYRDRELGDVDRRRLLAFIPVFAVGAIFAMLANQQFSVLALYVSGQVDRDVFGWSIPPAWFGSADAFGLVAFAPLLAVLWTRLGDRQPGTHRKMSLGLLLAGVSFLVLALPTGLASAGEKIGALWVIAAYLALAMAEVTVGPVGLSSSSKLAPPGFASRSLGLWFLSGAMGNGIGAQVVKLYDQSHAFLYFLSLGGATLLAAALLYLLAPRLRPLLGGYR